MNKYFTFLFAVILILTGCTKNGDEPKPVAPEKVFLTIDNVAGTWEVYYSLRAVDGGYSLRDLSIDGARITYNKNYTYTDYKLDGSIDTKGTFRILEPDSIEVTILEKKGKRLKSGEEERKVHIIQLTDKKMTRSHKYQVLNRNTMEETFLFRNINKISSPNETPDLPDALKKTIIDRNKLLGTWEIYYVEQRFYHGSELIEILEPERPLGTILRYYTENGVDKFQQTDSEGVTSGTIRIVDDVIHMFNPNGAEGAEGYTMRLKRWDYIDGTDILVDYDERRIVDDNPFYYVKQETYLKRKSSE